MTKPDEVMAIYFPSWHPYDHSDAWYGRGFTEWENVKSARPLFEGHHQPKVPEWGYFDESDPAWSTKEIDLASEHGITCFLFDWYWYSGVKIMEEALERGFLKAPNRGRLKFALMWANHDWWTWPARSGKPGMSAQQAWLHIRHDFEDIDRMIDYCSEHYFGEENYLQIDGMPYFSIYYFPTIKKQLEGKGGLKKAVERMKGRAGKNGFDGLHLNANIACMQGSKIYCWDWEAISELKEAGFDSVFGYNLVRTPDYLNLPHEMPVVKYDEVIKSHEFVWSKCEGKGLPFFPGITLGCDVTPRWHRGVKLPYDYKALSYEPIIVNNTPEKFGELAKKALAFMEKSASRPKILTINAWNEWTEGMYLLPEKKYGTGYLEALRDALRS